MDALSEAIADPLNSRAIELFREHLHMRIVRTDQKTASETFTGKNGESAIVFVELLPRK